LEKNNSNAEILAKNTEIEKLKSTLLMSKQEKFQADEVHSANIQEYKLQLANLTAEKITSEEQFREDSENFQAKIEELEQNVPEVSEEIYVKIYEEISAKFSNEISTLENEKNLAEQLLQENIK